MKADSGMRIQAPGGDCGEAEREIHLCQAQEQQMSAAQALVERKGQRRNRTMPRLRKPLRMLRRRSQMRRLRSPRRTAAIGGAESNVQPLGTEIPHQSTGRRLAFAKWLVDRNNPLTARVAINHIWLRHFGTPLVDNMFDFGLRSRRSRAISRCLIGWPLS